MRPVRAFPAILVALALLLGIGGHAVRAAGQTAQAADEMAVATVSDQMMPNCDMCGRGEAARPSCVSVCIGTALIHPETASMAAMRRVALVSAACDQRIRGAAIRPDPYPPKAIVPE